VGLPGNTFHVIAEDGSPVWEVWENDTLFLPSGKRFDVLVTATGNGSIPLGAMNSSFVLPYEQLIATVNVQGNQKDMEHANINTRNLTYRADQNNNNMNRYRVLNFS